MHTTSTPPIPIRLTFSMSKTAPYHFCMHPSNNLSRKRNDITKKQLQSSVVSTVIELNSLQSCNNLKIFFETSAFTLLPSLQDLIPTI